MTKVFEIPLRDASPEVLEELQAKFPDAVLRIEAEVVPANGMNEDKFWTIIDLLDWKHRDSETIIAPAVKTLSELSLPEITAFHGILAEKLYALDGQQFAENLGGNRYSNSGEKHFSADSFLYSRCAVVANGKEFFEWVLRDPSKMPKEFTFESLLYLPAEAYRLKTGTDDYDYHPDTWYETFSNPDGWPGITPLKDRITNLS